jgi:hypothetical protein
MEFPQSTFEEIVESERSMVIAARERYGAFYAHARDCSAFLSRSVVAVCHGYGTQAVLSRSGYRDQGPPRA